MIDILFAKVRDEDAARSDDARLEEGPIFKALFLKRSPLIINELFPLLRDRLTCPEFQSEFLTQFHKSSELKHGELCAAAQKCEAAGHDSRFYSAQLPILDRKLAISSLDAYLEFLHNAAEGHQGIIECLAHDYAFLNDGSDGTEYVKERYSLYQIGSFLYECHLAKVSMLERFEHRCAAELASLYKDRLSIDLASADPQFDKYRLLSLNSESSIVNSKESQTVVDARIGLNFWVDVPCELLAAIEDAIANRWVTDIAFDITLITQATPAFEGVEYGNVFSFQALQLPRVSKVYDEERYDNALWIQVGTRPYSMTFEELCADFPALDGKVVTQVIHLEFLVEHEMYFIGHLDHEYILYTQNDYDRRRYDASVKGYKKLKTFKVDKARIPFDFMFRGCYFLFLVLDAYFKNKGLIREYFAGVSQD